MSDVRLREAERDYVENPIYDNAYKLVSLLKRVWSPPIDAYGGNALYGTHCATMGTRPVVELVLHGRSALFVDGYPAAFRLDSDTKHCYQVADFRGPNRRAYASAVNAFCSGFCSGGEIVDTSEYEFNWAVAETYGGRYHRLMRAYVSPQLLSWQDHPAVVGIIADTYLQSKQEPHGHPMTAYRGIDITNYRGHRVTSPNYAVTIDFGETYKMLTSYSSPSAAVNQITGQCFYTLNRTKTTANHIGHFLRAHARNIDKWQKDCIELPQAIFDALLS